VRTIVHRFIELAVVAVIGLLGIPKSSWAADFTVALVSLEGKSIADEFPGREVFVTVFDASDPDNLRIIRARTQINTRSAVVPADDNSKSIALVFDDTDAQGRRQLKVARLVGLFNKAQNLTVAMPEEESPPCPPSTVECPPGCRHRWFRLHHR
jgi:hypothetical protein